MLKIESISVQNFLVISHFTSTVKCQDTQKSFLQHSKDNVSTSLIIKDCLHPWALSHMHIFTRIFSRISQNQKSEYEILKITVKIPVNLSVNMFDVDGYFPQCWDFPGIGAN